MQNPASQTHQTGFQRSTAVLTETKRWWTSMTVCTAGLGWCSASGLRAACCFARQHSKHSADSQALHGIIWHNTMSVTGMVLLSHCSTELPISYQPTRATCLEQLTLSAGKCERRPVKSSSIPEMKLHMVAACSDSTELCRHGICISP